MVKSKYCIVQDCKNKDVNDFGYCIQCHWLVSGGKRKIYNLKDLQIVRDGKTLFFAVNQVTYIKLNLAQAERFGSRLVFEACAAGYRSK